MGAAVLRPCLVRVTRIEWSLDAVADCFDPPRVDSEGRQILLGDVGPAVSQGEVVLLGPALVAVAFDQYADIGVTLEPGGGGAERGLSLRGQGRLIVREEGILDPSARLCRAIQLFDIVRK